jgi:hypothetical protein
VAQGLKSGIKDENLIPEKAKAAAGMGLAGLKDEDECLRCLTGMGNNFWVKELERLALSFISPSGQNNIL